MVLIGDRLFPVRKKFQGKNFTLEESGSKHNVEKRASVYRKWNKGRVSFYVRVVSKKDPSMVGGIRYALYLRQKG